MIADLEVWKVIIYYNNYEVSTFGRVRNRNTRKFLKPQSSKRAGEYLFVNLYKNGVRRNRNIHVLVSRTFRGPTPPGMVIHHKDTNRKNPMLFNLEFKTHKENNWRNHTVETYKREEDDGDTD